MKQLIIDCGPLRPVGHNHFHVKFLYQASWSLQLTKRYVDFIIESIMNSMYSPRFMLTVRALCLPAVRYPLFSSIPFLIRSLPLVQYCNCAIAIETILMLCDCEDIAWTNNPEYNYTKIHPKHNKTCIMLTYLGVIQHRIKHIYLRISWFAPVTVIKSDMHFCLCDFTEMSGDKCD